MALYAMGKTAAVAAIKAAVSARVQTMSDGTLKLDTPSLYQWLLDQAQLVIDEDVAPANMEAARGVLATIDSGPAVNRLDATYSPANWASHPEYPTTKRIAASSTFVSSASSMDYLYWICEIIIPIWIVRINNEDDAGCSAP